jgi:hypothetical protein
MTATWKMIAVATGLLTLGACADTDATPDDGGYLFGLSRAELLSIQPLVGAQHEAEDWLAFNRAPFSCARYDDLCDLVGAPAAEELTRTALLMAVEGAPLQEIQAEEQRAILAGQKAQEERTVAQATPGSASARSSEVDFANYSCGNHRLRIETYKVSPVIGARYGEATCKLQEDLGSGIWGGSATADLEVHVEIVGYDEEASATQNTHSLTTPKVYPGKNQTVKGTCTGTHNNQTLTVAESVD